MSEAIAELVRSGRNLDQVIAATGCKKIDVLRACGERGLLYLLRGRIEAGKDTAIVNREKRSGAKDGLSERAQEVASMFADGKRPKQVAIELGVSTQAIYYLIRRYKLDVPQRVSAVDPKMSKKYGMPMDKVRYLQSIGATRAFTCQRNNAKRRGIGWELTLQEWWALWEESGKWERRGVKAGGYVMGRHGDLGPYAVGNVVVCTHRENVMEREKHSPAFRRLQKSQENCVDADRQP